MEARERKKRRDFCKTAVTTSLTLSLGGCVGISNPDKQTSLSTPQGNEQFRAELGLPAPKAGIEPELNVLQWNQYWHPNTIPDFEDAYGVSVNTEIFTSNEELYQRVASDGLDTWDLIVPSDWMISRMINEKWLKPLQIDRLENWDNLGDQWVSDPPYDSGQQRYSVPYMWGTTGIAWHKQLVDGPLSELNQLGSWDAMWNERYAGQIQMMSLPRELYAPALKRLGYSLNTTDEAEIAEATELLIQQKELVGRYEPAGFIDDLINKRATPLHTFSGEALTARTRLKEQKDSPIVYQIPEEGGVIWVDGMVMPRKAQHPNAALTLIDFLLNDTISARTANFTFYGSPNEAAKAEIAPELLSDPAIYPPAELRDRLEFIQNVDDADSLYQSGWDRVQRA
jgi:spermidine/putrescine transport system substrate-binding protein